MRYGFSSLAQYEYNLYTKQLNSVAVWSASGTVETAPNKRFLIADNSSPQSCDFVSDGVAAGDIVTMDVGLETATVVEVVSATQLFTTALSDSGTYGSGEAFTITRDAAEISTGWIETTDPSTICCIDTDADFLTNGVMAGDTVTLTIGGETATVSYVSEDFIVTSALGSPGGNYDVGEAFTIADGNILRLYVPTPSGSYENFIRLISAKSDAATGTLAIYSDYEAKLLLYKSVLGTPFQQITPCLAPQSTNLYIELSLSSAGSLQVAYESR
jgi:hypothetical protein